MPATDGLGMPPDTVTHVVQAIRETADGMRRTRIMDAGTHDRVARRHLDKPTGTAGL